MSSGGSGAGAGAGAGTETTASGLQRAAATKRKRPADTKGPATKTQRKAAWTSNGGSKTRSAELPDHPVFHAPFDLSKLSPEALMQVALDAFIATGVLEELQVDVEKLQCFLTDMRSHYRANPYHNWTHAVDVLCGSLRLVRRVESKVPAVERVALLTAAIIHDVEHPGVSNKALVEAESEWALVYNDVSPLENRSLFVASRALRSPRSNFVHAWGENDRRRMRNIMCDIVLATDLTDKGREDMNDRKWKQALLPDGSVNFASDDARISLLRVILQCADLQSTTADFDLFIRWGSRLFLELRAHNPSLTTAVFANVQSGFLEKMAPQSWIKLRDAGITDNRHVAAIRSNWEAWGKVSETDRDTYLWHAK